MVEINLKYRDGRWTPHTFVKSHFNRVSVQALYRLSNFCIVSSLHDGMNLVAKDFLPHALMNPAYCYSADSLAQPKDFTGCIQINPYAIDTFAEAIKTADEMPADERKKRMQRLRERIREHNVYNWGQKHCK